MGNQTKNIMVELVESSVVDGGCDNLEFKSDIVTSVMFVQNCDENPKTQVCFSPSYYLIFVLHRVLKHKLVSLYNSHLTIRYLK